MIHRRDLLATGMTALAAPVAFAQASWRQAFPEITFAVVPAENATGVLARYEPFVAHLATELGVKVTMRIANDYAAVIEGMRSGQIQLAYFGPAAYARAYVVTQGAIEAFATVADANGAIGYYSVLYVRANDPATRIEDLKGRNLCLVDPNSTSGNVVPRFALDHMGIEPENYFARTLYAGSHENAVLALGRGTCDGAFNNYVADDDSNLSRMANKGMAKREDFRIIFRSSLIPGQPYALLSALPEPMKAAIRTVVIETPTRNPEAFARIRDGVATGFKAVTHADYQVVVALNAFVDQLRRKRS